MNVYQNCPLFENDRFLLRIVSSCDVQDLLKVYSDVNAVPFFNSDNCHGDDFHYQTLERMQQAVDFWLEAYVNGWFVRWSIVDKQINKVIGTIEGFRRDANDYFSNCGLLCLDLRSEYEKADIIVNILSLIVNSLFEMFGCDKIATKAWNYAVERRQALTNLGFSEILQPLVGSDGTKYYSYFALNYII